MGDEQAVTALYALPTAHCRLLYHGPLTHDVPSIQRERPTDERLTSNVVNIDGVNTPSHRRTKDQSLA